MLWTDCGMSSVCMPALDLVNLSFLHRHNFSGPKWKDRIIVPESVYLLDDFTASDSLANTHNDKTVVIPNRDVLIESYHDGVSMIDIMRGGNAQDSVQSAHNKELAALGLDAILKMVRFCCYSYVHMRFVSVVLHICLLLYILMYDSCTQLHSCLKTTSCTPICTREILS